MNLSLLAADGNYTQWIMIAIVGVLFVGMIVYTVISSRKRKQQQDTMMNSLVVGTKIMTIGRMVGKITQVNSDNTLIVNVGTENSPTLIVIDRQAVGLVLENAAAPVAPAPAAEPAPELPQDEPVQAEAPEEAPAEEKSDLVEDPFKK
ncbi:MAG: preprotein translocase subunit YajC [Clostridia bacterium]|nr:preprotein translocase subunit YajC [Clostridia bacterium]